MTGMSTLTDADLTTPTTKHWGEVAPTSDVIAVMIMHDTYHAGEINHLRALRHANDTWFADQAHSLDAIV